MDRLVRVALTGRMTTTKHPHDSTPSASEPTAHPTSAAVVRAIERRSYAVLSTVSPAGRPHGAGILYCWADGQLYLTTDRSSRKGQNLAAHPWAGVTIPVRRLPIGPPSAVHFQARAEVLDRAHPEVLAQVVAGRLKGITSHGELDRPDVCVVRLTPVERLHTYGLGLSLRKLIADPLNAGGSVDL